MRMIENGQYKIVMQPHAKGAILPRRWGNALRHTTIEQTKPPTTIALIFRIMRLSAHVALCPDSSGEEQH